MNETLIQEYNAANQHGKAAIEVREWEQAPLEARQGKDKSKVRGIYLQKLFNIPPYDPAMRGRLYNLGSDAYALWERVDGEMTLKTAADLAVCAKKRNLPLPEAIQEELRLYDLRPYKRYIGNGKFIRTGGSTLSVEKKLIIPATKPATKPAIKKKPTPTTTSTNTHAFWDGLRKMLTGYCASFLGDLPKPLQEELYVEFEVELKVLCSNFQSRLSRNKQQYSGTLGEVHRKHLLSACKTLSIKAPKSGELVNLEEAKKMKKKMASIYHPDKHDESIKKVMEQKFNEALSAYEVLETYNLTQQ